MRPGTQFETEHFGDENMRTLIDPAGDKKKALQMIYCKMNQAYVFANFFNSTFLLVCLPMICAETKSNTCRQLQSLQYSYITFQY